MKTLLPCLLTITSLLVVTSLIYPQAEAAGRRGSVYRHIVLFSFNEETTDDEAKEVEAAFGTLPDAISSITGFEWGTNVSPEGLADGFTHCFLVTFKDKAGLEEYLPHEAHQAFVKLVKPRVAKVLVIDYQTER
jgi:hypothetical protein